MSEQLHKDEKPHLCMGLLAHVDAGKTTLSESLLYLSGKIRKLGRVDHKDTYLDTYELERARGITIFSKQAELSLHDTEITLLDTPGHVDFSAEMERTLQVLDYAVLIISGADGVQGHVETLWKLLHQYQVPTFLFVNKMDQEGTNAEHILSELKERLSDNCVDFTEDFQENLAMCDEEVMEYFLEHNQVTEEQVRNLILQRKVFPCYFGSALKLQGLDTFVEGLCRYTKTKSYPREFGARIYKISRDEKGNRLTHMKITGGSLKAKTLLSGMDLAKEEWQEKVDQIRIYSGTGFEMQQEIGPGRICAVTGLSKTYVGQGLGIEETVNIPVLEPVLNYKLILPEGCNVHALLLQLRQLEEEEPLLRVVWKEEVEEIHAQLMGQVQIEVLKTMILERFGVVVEFGNGSIVYKETLLEPVEGVGHFEPLRHYAEVHLLMEPAEPGSGLEFATDCSEDVLDKNWQRLILTHLEEKKHKGVLTGSEITDVKITIINGRAHQKHTEGGDFRQATYRAVRHGLKMGKCRLLEPVYEFRLEVPSELIGRAMTDIQKRHGSFGIPELVGEMSVLTGTVPVATLEGYQTEVLAYSSGKGKLFCTLKGYEPCHNQEEIIEQIGYDSEHDTANPTGSVFCAHGAGFVVDYSQVYDYMHLEGRLVKKQEEPVEDAMLHKNKKSIGYIPENYDPEELDEIFRRTYGDIKKERRGWTKTVVHGTTSTKGSPTYHKYPDRKNNQEEYLLVDGYNIIFSWDDLNELAQVDIGAARGKLMDVLCNYQGYKKCTVILVFDAYKVEGNPGSSQKYQNIHVVYTKEAETADQYIEKVTHELGRKYQVTVATSDALEQVIILGQGAQRMSAKGLKDAVEAANQEIRKDLKDTQSVGSKNYLFDNLDEELSKEMEKVRLGSEDVKKLLRK